MKTYRIYKHPAHSVSTVVKVGFCWPAFIIGPLWFLLNKMWLTFLLSVAFTFGAPMVSRQLDYPATQSDAVIALFWTVFVFFVWFLTGKVANFLLSEELKGNGYEPIATVVAKNADEARREAARMPSQPKAE
jgi:Protein of unknown function (DUF2628)